MSTSASDLPEILCTFEQWMVSQGWSDKTAEQYHCAIRALSREGFTPDEMTSDAYENMIKEKYQCKSQSALRVFKLFWPVHKAARDFPEILRAFKAWALSEGWAHSTACAYHGSIKFLGQGTTPDEMATDAFRAAVKDKYGHEGIVKVKAKTSALKAFKVFWSSREGPLLQAEKPALLAEGNEVAQNTCKEASLPGSSDDKLEVELPGLQQERVTEHEFEHLLSEAPPTKRRRIVPDTIDDITEMPVGLTEDKLKEIHDECAARCRNLHEIALVASPPDLLPQPPPPSSPVPEPAHPQRQSKAMIRVSTEAKIVAAIGELAYEEMRDAGGSLYLDGQNMVWHAKHHGNDVGGSRATLKQFESHDSAILNSYNALLDKMNASKRDADSAGSSGSSASESSDLD